jgi:hypothetical protein
MDTEYPLQFDLERLRARRRAEQRLATAGGVVAELLDTPRHSGSQPSSREIADAIVRWLRTGERG